MQTKVDRKGENEEMRKKIEIKVEIWKRILLKYEIERRTKKRINSLHIVDIEWIQKEEEENEIAKFEILFYKRRKKKKYLKKVNEKGKFKNKKIEKKQKQKFRIEWRYRIVADNKRKFR